MDKLTLLMMLDAYVCYFRVNFFRKNLKFSHRTCLFTTLLLFMLFMATKAKICKRRGSTAFNANVWDHKIVPGWRCRWWCFVKASNLSCIKRSPEMHQRFCGIISNDRQKFSPKTCPKKNLITSAIKSFFSTHTKEKSVRRKQKSDNLWNPRNR